MVRNFPARQSIHFSISGISKDSGGIIYSSKIYFYSFLLFPVSNIGRASYIYQTLYNN